MRLLLPRPTRPLVQAPRRAASLAAALAVVLATAACSSREAGAAAGGSASAGPAASGASGASVPASVAAVPAGDNDSTALRARADSGRIIGAPTAKVWMLIVSDFQCPYCKMWEDQSWATIKRDYVDAGKVRVAYLHFPLDQHEQAMPTAEASMCAAAQGKFWEYSEALFATVPQWGKAGDQSRIYDSLATAHGVDVGRFRACTQSHVMRAVILADQDRMRQAGVQSTPSFFVGNTPISGAQPVEVFRRALDAAIAAAPR
jgi:protein-disulfide isomerase